MTFKKYGDDIHFHSHTVNRFSPFLLIEKQQLKAIVRFSRGL